MARQNARKSQRITFFKNLKPLPFTERAVREFNRRGRAEEAAFPVPFENDDANHPKHRAVEDFLLKMRRFGGRGGPNLDCLRGYRVQDLRPAAAKTARESVVTDTDGRHDRLFVQHLKVFGLHLNDDGAGPKPSNWEQLQARMVADRAEFTMPEEVPSSEDPKYAYFDSLYPSLRGNGLVEKGRLQGRRFISRESPPNVLSNLLPLTDSSVDPAEIALYDGAVAVLEPHILDELELCIKPSATNPLILPNFFLNIQNPNSDEDVLKRRACFAAAHGARGMQELRSFGAANTGIDAQARTICFTAAHKVMRAYSIHPALNKDGLVDYWVSELGNWEIGTGREEPFVEMVNAFRNLREWAMEQREEAIREVKRRTAPPLDPAATAGSVAEGSEGEAGDEEEGESRGAQSRKRKESQHQGEERAGKRTRRSGSRNSS